VALIPKIIKGGARSEEAAMVMIMMMGGEGRPRRHAWLELL
jgi:hypothetical protein